MLPIVKKITNFNHKKDDKISDIEYIVIHDTGNYTDSAEGNAKYFAQDGRNASAHYFIDNDNIIQVVEDKDIAWHVGDGKGKYGITNSNSLGIEMCRVDGTVTSETEKITLELAKYLMEKYNVPFEKVIRHYDASKKNCPSSFSANNWERWEKFKDKLKTTNHNNKTIYRVQVGAFSSKDNANKMLEDLKKQGFNGIITVVEI